MPKRGIPNDILPWSISSPNYRVCRERVDWSSVQVCSWKSHRKLGKECIGRSWCGDMENVPVEEGQPDWIASSPKNLRWGASRSVRYCTRGNKGFIFHVCPKRVSSVARESETNVYIKRGQSQRCIWMPLLQEWSQAAHLCGRFPSSPCSWWLPMLL